MLQPLQLLAHLLHLVFHVLQLVPLFIRVLSLLLDLGLKRGNVVNR